MLPAMISDVVFGVKTMVLHVPINSTKDISKPIVPQHVAVPWQHLSTWKGIGGRIVAQEIRLKRGRVDLLLSLLLKIRFGISHVSVSSEPID
jgi:hypothetical protein